MESQEKIWDCIAKKWNKFREIPSPSVVDFLKDKKGKILDLGCGSGRNFGAFQKGVEIYGVDFSSEMLKFAKKKAKSLDLDFNFFKADATVLPFENNFFDSVICTAVLHCVESNKKRKKTIKEIFRILKPNSSAFISVWGRNSPRLKGKPKECFVPWTVKSKKDFRKKEQKIKQERYTYIYSLKEIEKDFLKAGFKIEKIWEERNINLIVRK